VREREIEREKLRERERENHVTGWSGSNALTHTAGEPYIPVVTYLK
jgi:hypothetical protein